MADRLATASVLSIGKTFPSFAVIDKQEKRHIIPSFSKATYTLVDFWYSNCAPCIAQFPELKTIYDTYKSKGFEITGISTDKPTHKEAWQRMINKYELVWPQYWDVAGKEANKLSITAFPTNFLLDKNGKIVKKNIKPAELNQFLSEQSSE